MAPRFLLNLGLSLILALLPGTQQSVPSPSSGRAGAPALLPTAHPPVPDALDDFWLVPRDPARPPATSATGALGAAVELLADGKADQALARLDPQQLAGTPLVDYAVYYTGLMQLELGRLDEARRAFAAVRERRPEGALVEAATLGEAEAAEGQQDHEAAMRLYESLLARETSAPDQVLYRLGRAALAAGDRERAAKALARVYYEFALTDTAPFAATELERLRDLVAPARDRFPHDLGRAERLFEARRYPEARAAFEPLRAPASGDDRELVDLRLAECDFYLKRYARARDALAPYLDRASRKAEARFFHLSALRGLGRHADSVARTRRLVEEFPDSSWAEEALNDLGTHYILQNDDAKAAEVFAELYATFPTGGHAERAAWKAGWWAFRRGDPAETPRYFERAAATFPRSDYRPAYLYWAGRAHDRLANRAIATERYTLVVTDYGNTYYGRLASKLLGERRSGHTTEPGAPAVGASREPRDGARQPALLAPPPTAPLIRALLAAGLYDDAMNELGYAQRKWGNSPALEATTAWVHQWRGELRRGITAMKRAYPQYMTAGRERLPEPILKVVFPLDYWDLIRKHARARDLDPYLVAALIAQESTFDPVIRSAANAYGLMQIVPATGRRLARTLGIRRFRTAMLTDPETNVRMGTTHFASLLARFGKAHLALAGYNAGEHRVVRWVAERGELDADEFIDDIPFPETQNYVKRILGTAEDYRRLYGAE